MAKTPIHYHLIIRHLNAKLVYKKNDGESGVGDHEKDQIKLKLLEFVAEYGLSAINSFFKKKKEKS